MRILLILPYDSTYKYKGFFKRSLSYAPLTLSTLAALVPKELEAHIDIVDEGVQKPKYEDKLYDVVGITCVTSSSPRAYSLAKYWRSKGAFVVLGGAHPTLMPQEASMHADSVIIGHGERSWAKLLLDYKIGLAKKIYEDTQDGSISCPIPRRDLLPNKYLKVPTVIANRGCRNCCEFCCIHKLWGCRDFTRPIGEVMDEIKALNSKRILLLDPSPFSNREYVKEFLSELCHMQIAWAGLSTIDVAEDDELLELTFKSGCEGLLIGFESFNQLNLNDAGKGFNNVKKYKAAVDKLHAGDISILGCFVLGFDNDTKEDFECAPDIIEQLGIDLPRFSVLTPFPGTDLFTRFKNEGRILTEDWWLYDTEHVVFKPKNMSPDDLQEQLYKVWSECYEIGRVIKRGIRMKNNRLLGLITNMGFRFYARRLSGGRFF